MGQGSTFLPNGESESCTHADREAFLMIKQHEVTLRIRKVVQGLLPLVSVCVCVCANAPAHIVIIRIQQVFDGIYAIFIFI